MRYKWIYGILVLCVSALMLMQSVLAATGPPIVWANETIFVTVTDSEDPENYGIMNTQVVVWQEENPSRGDWDIWMRYSFANGLPLSWVAPPTEPATTVDDEIRPAIAVTREHPATGIEIHVVYEKDLQGINEVWHAYAWFLGGGVLSPWTSNQISTADRDAHNPAIVYTEDHTGVPGPVGWGWGVQMVWQEDDGNNVDQIMYSAFVYDPNFGGARPERYTEFGPVAGIKQVVLCAGSFCEKPEIASVDETAVASYDLYFAVVWEDTVGGFKVVNYDDGTLTVGNPPPNPVPPLRSWDTIALTPGSFGQISPVLQQNAIDPDIAATQDYAVFPAVETFFFHIVYALKNPDSIETHYTCGITQTPGAAAFIQIFPSVQGPPVATPPLDNPTVAVKLVITPPSSYEAWFAWEDSSTVTPRDIFYRMCGYTVGVGWLGWLVGQAPVGYTGLAGQDIHPEIWNRNDVTGLQPLTHLVFEDNPAGNNIGDITYIDP